jgi:hypothetical protein
MNAPQETASEAGKALDALAALSVQLSCDCDVHPDTLILPARKVREACNVIDEAVSALKQIMTISAASGDGPGIAPST